jgi:WD40 repeat protein
VTDFGLARLGGNAGLTLTGDLLGTLRYMSPEQALARRAALDARTDVYSLGVTLYELLTLEPAYDGRSREEVLRQIAFEEPRPPRRLNKAIPGELETVVLKAMAKSPEERYPTAAELAEDLRRFLDDRVIRARRPTPWQRLRKWSRRHRTALATLAATAAVALLALLAVSFRHNTELRGERDNAVREKNKADDALEARCRVLYAAHTQLAHREWQEAHLRRVLELLDGPGCPPELRGWEWYYLRGLCHKEARSLPAVPLLRPSGVAFGRDGRRLAVARATPPGDRPEGLVELWDLLTGRRLFTFRGHTDRVASAAFGPGRWLASAGDDGTVRVWDTETLKEVRTFRDGHGWARTAPPGTAPRTGPDRIHSVAFSPDGKRLAVSSWDGDVRILDASAADPRKWRWIPTQGRHNPLDIANVTPLEWREVLHHGKRKPTGHVHCVAFSPDGRRLASASTDRTVKVWDAVTGKCLGTLEGHTDTIRAVAFSPDGQTLASAGEDMTVRLWGADLGAPRGVLRGHFGYVSGSPRKILRGHSGSVVGVAFRPDGRQLASASEDGTVRLWDPASGAPTRTLRGHTAGLSGAAFGPDGRLASWGHDGIVKFWDPTTGPQEFRPLPVRTKAVHAVAFSPDGATLASAGKDWAVQLWDVPGGQVVRTIPAHKGEVLAVAFSPDGRRLASAGEDKTVKLWDVPGGKALRTFTGHTDLVRGVAFSPDGRHLASASTDGTVKLWDVAGGRVVRTYRGHAGEVLGVAFSPEGRHLASAGDKTVKLWDVAGGEALHTFTGHTDLVCAVAFSPDGRQLVSASADATVKLWDPATGEELFTFRDHSSVVSSVAFSRDGRRLFSGGADGSVKVWDTASRQQTLSLANPGDFIYAVALSPNGRWLASAGSDKHLKLREAPPHDGNRPGGR